MKCFHTIIFPAGDWSYRYPTFEKTSSGCKGQWWNITTVGLWRHWYELISHFLSQILLYIFTATLLTISAEESWGTWIGRVKLPYTLGSKPHQRWLISSLVNDKYLACWSAHGRSSLKDGYNCNFSENISFFPFSLLYFSNQGLATAKTGFDLKEMHQKRLFPKCKCKLLPIVCKSPVRQNLYLCIYLFS